MSKDENSPPCSTDHAFREMMGAERGTAAAAQACLKDEWRRELTGEEEEAQQLVLPKVKKMLGFWFKGQMARWKSFPFHQ